MSVIKVTCPECEGGGTVEEEHQPGLIEHLSCMTCRGKGEIDKVHWQEWIATLEKSGFLVTYNWERIKLREPEPEPGLPLVDVLGGSLDLQRPISDFEYIRFSWDGFEPDPRSGQIVTSYKIWGGGHVNYRGTLHPNGVCEGEGICIYCGVTLW